MFLLNSCLDLFSAPRFHEDPFFRSYGVNLPNSLTVNLPSALVYSTQPPVSVYGTGIIYVKLSGFSRELDYLRYHSTQKGFVYCQLSARKVDLPPFLTAYGL